MKMDIRFLKEQLDQHIKACGNLSNKLSDEGDPLTSDDKDLLRLSLMPHIKVVQSEFISSFITGCVEDIEHHLDYLRGITESLT